MKISRICGLLLAAALANGCAVFHHHEQAQPVPANNASSAKPVAPATADVTLHPIVTPDNSLTAKVTAYDATGRFTVLTFPIGQMPRTGQTLFLYRNGLKVGEVKITGPQRDNNVVADLVTGTAQVGDEVRQQ